MLTKRNLIATLVTGIWSFMGGYLIWGILAEGFLNDHLGSALGMGKEMPEFPLLAAGCFIQAFAFSTIYGKWANGDFSMGDGLKYGALIGILIGFGNGFITHATSNFLDMTGTLINGILYVVFHTIMGLLAAIIYNKVK